MEITVTLVLLAVAAALVTPVFRTPAAPNDSIRDLVGGARELAVRRAQTLVMNVDDRGIWRLTPQGDTTTIMTGSVNAAAIRIRVTPLGACFNEGQSERAAVDWDAIGCAGTTNRSQTR